MSLKIIDLAKELQFLAQGGITYTKDEFDLERFKRIRMISAELLACISNYKVDEVFDLFCNEIGFQTPKIDTRAVIFKDDMILLVQEKDGLYTLPGGWCDVNESIKTNTEKEVLEEAGLVVRTSRLVAILDGNKHNGHCLAYNILKSFTICDVVSGSFIKNSETISSGYFKIDNLPPLATTKVNVKQIKMCYEAYHNKAWQTLFD